MAAIESTRNFQGYHIMVCMTQYNNYYYTCTINFHRQVLFLLSQAALQILGFNLPFMAVVKVVCHSNIPEKKKIIELFTFVWEQVVMIINNYYWQNILQAKSLGSIILLYYSYYINTGSWSWHHWYRNHWISYVGIQRCCYQV